MRHERQWRQGFHTTQHGERIRLTAMTRDHLINTINMAEGLALDVSPLRRELARRDRGARVVIYPYKMGSASARLLADSLNALRVRPEGRYTPRSGDFIINWGSSTIPAWNERYRAILGQGGIRLLNNPVAVGLAANKLSAFHALQEHDVAVPDFTTDVRESEEWGREGYNVYARHRLTGHSGSGIEYLTPNLYEIENPNAPLFVKEIINHGEYRVHVANGRVIGYTKKRRRNGDPATDEQLRVRNLDNGWIFTRENLRRLDRIEDLAIRAVAALSLDFGAVDIIKDEEGDVFVLEVNTACGLSDATLDEYLEAFNEIINSNPSHA